MPSQIFSDGPDPAPLVYTVPGVGEVSVYACYAEYDGTSAGGDFVPALRFRSQAGHPIDLSEQDTTVAAGASAICSWFPRLAGGAAAAASAGEPWCYGDATLDLTGAAPSYVDFVTTDAAMFALDVTSTLVKLLATGTYLALGHLEIQSKTLPLTQGITLGTTLNNNASSSDSAAVGGNWDVGNPGGTAGTFRSWLPSQLLLITVNSISNISNPPTISASASANPAAVASGDFTMFVRRISDPLGTPL